MDKINPTELITTLAEYVRYVEERHDFLYDAIGKLNLKQTDLVHDIENEEFKMRKGYALAKELKEVRTKRRAYQNEMNQIKPLYYYLQNNKGLPIDLYKLKSKIEGIKTEQDNWFYRRRVENEEIEDN